MPFTAAHALAVLPLRRRFGLDTTCLLIGSMAPDFEYFVRVAPYSAISHTLRGLWMWNLPVTLALAVLYHALVKWPVLLVAPVAIARRAVVPVGAPWRARWTVAAVASCAVSAVIGAATHLGWDAFTHADSWGPQHIRVLTTPVHIYGATIVVHRLLQHGSTVVGLAVIGALVVRDLRRRAPVELPPVPRAGARAVMAACIAVAVALVAVRLVARHTTDIGFVIVGIISGGLAGTLVAGALLTPRARRLARAAGGHGVIDSAIV